MSKRICQAVVLYTLLSLSSCSGSQSEDEPLVQAREKMENSSFKEAVSLLDALLAENPRNAKALNMRGVAYFELESYGKALSDFNAAIEQDDQDYAFFYNRGNVKRNLKQPRAAVEDYTKALAIDSAHYEVWLNRALAYVGSGLPEKAAEDFRSAANKGGAKDPQVFFYMGRLMIGMGDFQEGLEAAKKCISLNKNHAAGHYMMALALLGVGAPEEEACSYAQASFNMGYKPAQAFIAQYCNEDASENVEHEGHNH